MHADVRNGVLPVTPCSFHWDQDNVSAGVHPHSQYHKTCYVIPLSATVACSLCASMSHAQRQVATADFPLVIVEAGGGDARDLVNVETVRLFLHLVGVGVGAVPEVDHGESVGVAILHHDRIISSDGCVGLAHVGMKQLSRGLCCQLSDYYLAARSGKGAELGHARGVVRRSELRYVRSMQKIVRLEDDVKLPDPNKHRSTDTVVVSRPQVERPQMALTRCLSPPPSLDYFGRWAVRG